MVRVQPHTAVLQQTSAECFKLVQRQQQISEKLRKIIKRISEFVNIARKRSVLRISSIVNGGGNEEGQKVKREDARDTFSSPRTDERHMAIGERARAAVTTSLAFCNGGGCN